MNRTKQEYSEQDKIAATDHDSLIRLESKVDQILVDIKELKDGVNGKIEQHELRLRSLENLRTRTLGIMIAVSIAITLFGLYIRGFVEDIYKHIYGH